MSREIETPHAFYTEILTQRVTVVHNFDSENSKITEWDWCYENNDIRNIVLFDGAQKQFREIYQKCHDFLVEKINKMNLKRIKKYEAILIQLYESKYIFHIRIHNQVQGGEYKTGILTALTPLTVLEKMLLFSSGFHHV